VAEVIGVNLFALDDDRWALASGAAGNAAITMERWQLPELLAVVAEVGEPSDDPSRLPNPYGGSEIAIPVVPEVC
jgi:hypothetical protein